MRTIKFRAWNKTDGEWLDLSDLAIDPLNGQLLRARDGDYAIFHDCDYELQQYTGLTDKNGKEIYEGDIVQEDDLKRIATVCFGRYPYLFPLERYGYFLRGQEENFELTANTCQSVEVIGDIYSTPELLENIKIMNIHEKQMEAIRASMESKERMKAELENHISNTRDKVSLNELAEILYKVLDDDTGVLVENLEKVMHEWDYDHSDEAREDEYNPSKEL